MRFILILIFICLTAWSEEMRTIHLHNDVIDDMFLDKGKLYTASFDGTVKQFDLKTGSVQLIGKGSDWIRTIVNYNGLIISGDNQGYIRAWDHFGKKRWEIKAHNWWIMDMVVWKDQLITVSMDETLKVWDLKTYKLLFEEKIYGSHKHHAVCIGENDTAFVGSTSTISRFPLNEKETGSGSIYGYDSSIVYLSCLNISDKTFFGTSKGFLVVYSHVNQKTIHVSDTPIHAIAEYDQMLYVASDDGSIKIIDLNKLSLMKTFYQGKVPICSIAATKEFIYIGLSDGRLKILRNY